MIGKRFSAFLIASLVLINLTFAQTWTQIFPDGDTPYERVNSTAVYDTTNNRMILYGGFNGNTFDGLWVLSNPNNLGETPTWTSYVKDFGFTLPSRATNSGVFDAVNNKLIVYGGDDGHHAVNSVFVIDIPNAPGSNINYHVLQSTTVPPGREYHTAVYDPNNNRMTIFGGLKDYYINTPLNDVWVLSNANGLGGTPIWTQLFPTGSVPTTRYLHTAVYDIQNNLMIVFGGKCYQASNYKQYLLNDIWVLSNANGLGGTPEWTQITTSGSAPTPRSDHSAVYDSVNNRMIIFGGADGRNSIQLLNETWVLSHANGLGGIPTWTQITTPTYSPTPYAAAHTAIYDSVNNRMTIFGGGDGYHYLNDVWVLDHANGLPSPPNFPSIPSLKLFPGQSLNPAFNLEDYNTGDMATSYSIASNFLELSSLDYSTVIQTGYSSSTSGINSYIGENAIGSSTVSNKVKYSTYKIKRLPQVVLRPNRSWNVNVGNYTIDSTNTLVIPPSFNQSDSLIVSNGSQLTTAWLNESTVTITALSGFNSAGYVDVIASPEATAPYGSDIDKERIEIYPAFSTTAFEFNNSNDTALFSFQLPASGGPFILGTVDYLTSVIDNEGNPSHGGVLKISYDTPTSGVKITPKFSTWLPNTPQTWYTLRIRAFSQTPNNGFLMFLFNGVPGISPTDVEGYFIYSLPTTWTYFDIPINSYSSVSGASVMYPQIVFSYNTNTGACYIDEIEIFQGTPPLVNSRAKTSDNFASGLWNDSNATTQWVRQATSSFVNTYVSNGHLIINTLEITNAQTGFIFTAVTASGTIYTIPAKLGQPVGAHMDTKLISGGQDMTKTQVQFNLLGATGPNSMIESGDIAAVAELGRISDRTLRLAFYANNQNYQVQFVVKNLGTSTIQIDNTQADMDNDDPNYGDVNLFP